MNSWKDKIEKTRIPNHIAIIMDGNGRWAKKHGLIRALGHKSGVKAVQQVVEAAVELGVSYLTLYAFSTDNWSRPKMEVNALMELMIDALNKEKATFAKNNISLKTIGETSSLPKRCQKKLAEVVGATAGNDGLTLVLALSYGAKEEILQAVKSIAQQVEENKLTSENIDEEVFVKHLYTSDFPEPELMIRTSGEQRISNFLLWQLAYSELYFSPVLWPDFKKEDLFEAIVDYQNRERRFGKTTEQLNS
jgi:undecaprenyl diphosphate synthase